MKLASYRTALPRKNLVGLEGVEPSITAYQTDAFTNLATGRVGNFWVFSLHDGWSPWYRVRGSNPRQSICKNAALPTELTRRGAADPNPGTLRGHHDDVESGARLELAIFWVATRRHTNLTTRSIAGRQRIELCLWDLESLSATRTRPIQRVCTGTPERSECMEHGKHDFFFVVECQGFKPC